MYPNDLGDAILMEMNDLVNETRAIKAGTVPSDFAR
jgi:hypothetical protein